MDRLATITVVEDRAANAWPSAVVERLDGWRLRVTPNVNRRRSNSVLIIEVGRKGSVNARIRATEAFYRERGLPVRFQVTPLAQQLDQRLAELGYGKEGETRVQTSTARDVIGRVESVQPPHVDLLPEPSDDWVSTWAHIFALGDAKEQRIEILDRIKQETIYGIVREEEQPVAVGLAVVEAGWVGLFGCGTMRNKRRNKRGARLVDALLREALRRDAPNTYLAGRGRQCWCARLLCRPRLHYPLLVSLQNQDLILPSEVAAQRERPSVGSQAQRAVAWRS